MLFRSYMESAVRAQGLELRLGGELCKIRENGAGLAAYFTDSQEPVYADLILLCIGVRPNLSFVSPDEVKMSGGILVDSRMRTNQAGLYAAGDCTAGYDVFYQDNRMIGLMANARMQGRTAGRNMAGMADSYCGSTPHNITHFMGMDFVAVGEPMAEGNVFEQSLSDNRYFRIVWEKGRLLSVNLLNMPEIAGLLKNLFFKSQGVQMLSGGVQNTLEYEELVSYLIKKYRNERIR